MKWERKKLSSQRQKVMRERDASQPIRTAFSSFLPDDLVSLDASFADVNKEQLFLSLSSWSFYGFMASTHRTLEITRWPNQLGSRKVDISIMERGPYKM